MAQKIQSLLVANRAEIAVRIIATCRAYNIKVVTVYSLEDSELPHALYADASFCLGSGTLGETYLNQELILTIAESAGVDAIHPGYGFLSENAGFAQRVIDKGLIFIGPTPECIAIMGDKIAARVAAVNAGVPVVPGYNGIEQNELILQKEAQIIGYPVLIKAAAGGGGKGMRIVYSESEFCSALAQAKGEAKNSFGNDVVFLEKYIPKSRHIEIQVFSDAHGNHLHLFERECSIQRRHQKIIEESPSIAINQVQRDLLTNSAVALTRQISYLGAGTVEFIMEADEKSEGLYFLEMNTRLQVEHPVTEAVTGLDLVYLQIITAEGQKLPFNQNEVVQSGHAIECRIYAEDPERDHWPGTGTLRYIGAPTVRNLRLDIGYSEGNKITALYDPMIGKVITFGSNRNEAISIMQRALKSYTFAGVKTNKNFLLQILNHEAFGSGETYTSFLQDHKLSLSATSELAEALGIAVYEMSKNTMAMNTQENSSLERVWEFQSLVGFRSA
jgi:3-methylcrotonyl-CoA carboxylase alpha subunit